MRVEKVRKFLRSLKSKGSLQDHDALFCEKLNKHFSKRSNSDTLTSDDITLLLEGYEARSPLIMDSPNDYSLNPVGTALWIAFAREFAPLTHRTHLKILFPGIRNKLDYNNLSLLSETQKTENVYFGPDDHTLFRLIGLYEHIRNVHKLSTCRECSDRKLYPLTIIELWRIFKREQPDGMKTEEGVKYKSFWAYLDAVVFPTLQAQGELPKKMLPLLFDLIAKYYECKKSHADLSVFKNCYQHFLSELYDCHLDDINYFYGADLQCNEKKHYLLESLIAIQDAKSYSLGTVMKDLSEWLSKHYKPSQIVEAAPSASSSSTANEVRADRLLPLGQFIVSILTIPFARIMLLGANVSVWDQSSTVSHDAAALFNMVFPLIENNQEAEALAVFQIILEDRIKILKKNSGFLNPLRHQGIKTTEWYTKVEEGTLCDLGVQWFDPVLLLHACLLYKSSDKAVEIQVRTFVDEVIKTLNQQKSDLLKKLRVNILFTTLWMALTPDEQNCLRQQILSIDIQIAEKEFISNCASHIAYKLLQLETNTTFFSTLNDTILEQVNHNPPHKLIKIIEVFSAKVHEYSHSNQIDSHTAEAMAAYLISLKWRIRTVNELTQNSEAIAGPKYTGAFN